MKDDIPDAYSTPGPKSPEQGAPAVLDAEKVRQGEIVLRKPWERWVFAAGFAVPVVILLVIVMVWLF